MIRSPYKNISGKLEKGVYVCVYLLYGTHVLGFYFFSLLFFFFCVPLNMAGYFVSISSFLFGAPPRTSPFLPKIRPRMGDTQTFFPCLVSTVFSEEDGAGGGFLLILCTLVTYCTWKPHRCFFFVF